MKLYKDSNNQLYNYPDDGTQDQLIGNKTRITQEEADAIVTANLAAAGIPAVPAYIAQRAAAYPSIKDYIDGVVKGDQKQIDAYIAACQAVKAKYPKQ